MSGGCNKPVHPPVIMAVSVLNFVRFFFTVAVLWQRNESHTRRRRPKKIPWTSCIYCIVVASFIHPFSVNLTITPFNFCKSEGNLFPLKTMKGFNLVPSARATNMTVNLALCLLNRWEQIVSQFLSQLSCNASTHMAVSSAASIERSWKQQMFWRP